MQEQLWKIIGPKRSEDKTRPFLPSFGVNAMFYVESADYKTHSYIGLQVLLGAWLVQLCVFE